MQIGHLAYKWEKYLFIFHGFSIPIEVKVKNNDVLYTMYFYISYDVFIGFACACVCARLIYTVLIFVSFEKMLGIGKHLSFYMGSTLQ